MPDAVVIIGIGNLLAGDDGAGVRVAQSLASRPDLPQRIRIVEAGTLGPDTLAYIEESETVVLLDAVRGGDPPGSIYRVALEDVGDPERVPLSVHDLGIHHLLGEARLLGRPLQGVLLGIEPAHIEPFGTTLSSPVADALPRLEEAALREAQRLLSEE